MGLYDEDFILRQIRDFIRSLGRSLALESVLDLYGGANGVDEAVIVQLYYAEQLTQYLMLSPTSFDLLASQLGVSEGQLSGLLSANSPIDGPLAHHLANWLAAL